MENAYNQIYFKMFKTFDVHVVNQCQYFMKKLPLELKYIVQKLKFISCLTNSSNIVLKVLSGMDSEYNSICDKYLVKGDNQSSFDVCIWDYFCIKLDISNNG